MCPRNKKSNVYWLLKILSLDLFLLSIKAPNTWFSCISASFLALAPLAAVLACMRVEMCMQIIQQIVLDEKYTLLWMPSISQPIWSTALLHEGRWIFLAGKINPCPLPAQFQSFWVILRPLTAMDLGTVSKFKALVGAVDSLLLLSSQCKKAKLGTLKGLHAPSF